MPTSNDPLNPSNPHSEGGLHQSELQQKVANLQPSENTLGGEQVNPQNPKKRNKKSIFSALLILIPIMISITMVTLYYFKCIEQNTVIIFTIPLIIFSITCALLVFINNPAQQGEKYTTKAKFFHYLKFIFLPSLVTCLVIFLTLFIDTISTLLFDKFAPHKTPDILKNFFSDPSNFITLAIAIFLSLVPNFSNAISITTIIQEIFEEKRYHEKTKKPSKQEGSIKSTLKSHIKSLTLLLPASASMTFIFALIHNTQVIKDDLSTAIQITSIQFAESKYTWLVIAFSMLLIFYISSIPYFFLSQSLDSTEFLFHVDKNKNIQEKVEYLYLRVLAIASVLTFFSALINYQLLKILSPKESIIFLLLVTLLSSAINARHMQNIFDKEYATKDTAEIQPISHGGKTASFIFISIIIILPSLIGNALIPNVLKGFSDVITSPGDTLGSIETDYSCIFSNDNQEKSSIAFGVLTEAKPDSIHIFTPTYDYKRRAYGKKSDNGNIQLNNLTEAQIKIPTGYHVEKFNINKHYYDVTTGKCTQLTPLSFYESTQIKTKLVIRNIP